MRINTLSEAQQLVATPERCKFFGTVFEGGREDENYFWVNLQIDGFFSTYTGWFVEKATGKLTEFDLPEAARRIAFMKKVGDWSNPPKFVEI